MAEYVPSTEQIRKLVTDWIDVGGTVDGEDFDRFIAKIKADALREAADACDERGGFVAVVNGTTMRAEPFKNWLRGRAGAIEVSG